MGAGNAGGWQPQPEEPEHWAEPVAVVPTPPSTAKPVAEPRGHGVQWGAPLDLFGSPDNEGPKLRADHLPDALSGFVMDVAIRLGVDPAAVAISCLVCCASAVSDDWQIQPKRYDYSWTEGPRLWGAIVGDPSILKTPIIAICSKPLDKLDAAARHKHTEEMRSYKAALKAYNFNKDGTIPEPTRPKLPRHLIENTTVDALSEVLRDDDGATMIAPSRKVLCRHDEMSEFFAGLDRYNAGGKGGADRGAYLRLYNGGPYSVDRIGRGSFRMSNWSACFLGGIQPGPIQKIAKDASEDGLLQRFLYVVPGPQEPGWDCAPDARQMDRYNALFPALVALHPPCTDGTHADVIALHDGAHADREGLNDLARVLSLMPDTSARLKAAYGKLPGLFARLALTFHLIDIADARAQGNAGPFLSIIPEATAHRAAMFIREIALPHLHRANALMFATAQMGHAAWIAGFILSHSLTRITTRDVVRAYGALRAPEAAAELSTVMAGLVAAGWLEPEEPANATRSVYSWIVNPSVHETFETKAEVERLRRAAVKQAIAEKVESIHKARGL